LPRGTEAVWYRGPKLVKCLDCGLVPPSVTATTVEPPTVTPVEEEPDREPELDHPPVDQGVAGRSALREHERRRKRREDQARQKLGVIGVGLVKLAGDPQTTRSWERGANGEAFAGKRLEKHLAGSGVKLLHDRRVRGHGAANIDHIAVGPGGVTVIDTKRYKGKVTVERVGGLFSARREILKINGRDQTKLITGAEQQVQYVESALHAAGHTGVDVRGALCMAEVKGLPLLRSLTVRSILVDGPTRVAALSRRPGELPPETVDEIWRQLAVNFPSA
jgi:Nuclease-related domain